MIQNKKQNQTHTRKPGGGSDKIRFILIVAVSRDGKITTGTSEGSSWTSREDKTFFGRELDRCDVSIMGRKTYDAIRRPLALRNRVIFTRNPLFQCSAEYWNKNDAREDIKRDIKNATVSFSGSAKRLFKLLKKYDWKRIAVLGGNTVYDWFLKRGMVNEVYLTVEPIVFGGGKKLTSSLPKYLRRCRLLSVKTINTRGTLLLRYRTINCCA